jgi:hypothetical protein
MTLSKRELVLAAVTGVLLVPMVCWMGYRALDALVSDLRAQEAAAASSLGELTARIESLRKTEEQWNAWRAASLPSQPQNALLGYESWLNELIKKAGFPKPNVISGQRSDVAGVYRNLHFTVHTRAALPQVTQFLHGFYSAGHLHLIRRMELKPAGTSESLEVTIVIEALALVQADRTDKLSDVPGTRLASADLDKYKVIAERNFFAPYQPPRPVVKREAPPPEEPFDISKHAVFTASVQVGDQAPEIWVKSRTTDKTFYLCVGDSFEIGPMKGIVTRIGLREAEIEVSGKRHVVPLGESLRKGEVKAAGASPDSPDAKSAMKPGMKPEARPDSDSEVKREGGKGGARNRRSGFGREGRPDVKFAPGNFPKKK